MNMKKKNSKWRGRIMIVILLLNLFIFFNSKSSPILSTQAASGTFDEDFTTTTYMDVPNTNVSGWGTGTIENSKKKPSIVGSISSSLIGTTVDVCIDGNYAYVTNQEDGLKILNITDPSNPHIIGSYDTPNIAYSVFVEGDIAFLADNEGVLPQYENIIVLNVSDPTNPVHKGNCSTFFTAGDAARSITVDGNFAYIANMVGGMRIVNITDSNIPEPVGVRNTPGTSYKLVVDGDYAYLADGSNGLVILDVSDPTNPEIIGNYDTGLSDSINLVVEGIYAYVIDFNSGVIIIDITHPKNPTLAGSYSNNQLTDVSISGNYLYATDITDGLFVVNITNPTNPVLVDSITLPGNPYTIEIDGSYAYIACSNGGLNVVKISDIISPTNIGYFGQYGGIKVGSVIAYGDLLYVGRRESSPISSSDGTLYVLNVSDPYNPTEVGTAYPIYGPMDMSITGDYIYMALEQAGFMIANISNPTSPTIVSGSFNNDLLADSVFISGNFAYFTGYDFSESDLILKVYDISDPTSPSLVSSFVTPGSAVESYIVGDYAFIADSGSGLAIVDISDPTSPFLKSSFYAGETVTDVQVAGDYAYVATSGGFQVIDISDTNSPSLAGSISLGSGSYIYISGNYAYISSGSLTLAVVDISDPSSPFLSGSCQILTGVHDVVVAGDYAYIGAESYGVWVVEKSRNRVRQFNNYCTAESNVIYSPSSSSIVSATLTANDTNPSYANLTYYLSADNGNNWETVTPGIEHIFSNTGNQLKWQANLTTTDVSITAKIYNISITYKTLLNPPSLDNPPDSTVTDDYTPAFTWNAISGASEYLFQIDTSTSFAAPVANITIPSPTVSYTVVSSLDVDTHYWRVAAIDSEGDLGAFSNYRILYIIQDANVPTINAPNDVLYEQGATGNSITWTPSDSNPYWYNITLNSILTSHDDPWTGGNIVMDVDGLPLGIHTVVCSVYDFEGLMSSDIVEVEVTTTAPPTIDDVVDFGYEEGDTGNSITWHPSDANPDFYSITRNGLVIDDGPWLGGDINIDIDGLAYGVYIYICFVNDTEGQSNSDSVTITVTDIVIPILNSPGDVIYAEGETGNNIIWIATDTNPGTYVVYKDGTSYETDTWSSGSSVIISVDGLSSSQYNFTIVVEDQAGNIAKDTVIVAVTASVPELNHSFLFVIVSIPLVIIIYLPKRKNEKKG